MFSIHQPCLKFARPFLIAVGLAMTAGLQAADLLPDDPAVDASVPLQARGVLKPGAEAVLSSQIASQVVALPFREGDSFKAGDVLVKLECDFYQAQLSAVQAAASAARLQLESDRQLAQLNSIGTLEVQLSEARLRQTEADVQLNQVLTQRCAIAAPYAGRVVEWLIQPHESVTQDTKLLAIVALSLPEIRLVVPSTWLAWLKNGVAFQFSIDETGQILDAEVKSVGARIDAVSQTISVVAAIRGKPKGLVAGMSGTARFQMSSNAQSQAQEAQTQADTRTQAALHAN